MAVPGQAQWIEGRSQRMSLYAMRSLDLTYKTWESLKGLHRYVIKSSFSFSGPVARSKVDLMENKIGSKD